MEALIICLYYVPSSIQGRFLRIPSPVCYTMHRSSRAHDTVSASNYFAHAGQQFETLRVGNKKGGFLISSSQLPPASLCLGATPLCHSALLSSYPHYFSTFGRR